MSISPAIAPPRSPDERRDIRDSFSTGSRIPLRDIARRKTRVNALMRATVSPACSHRDALTHRHAVAGGRALNEAAAQHARLTLRRIVEHTGLSGRDAVLAGDEVDLDAVGTAAQPRRLRRPGRAHLDENLVPARAQGLIDRAVAQPIHVTQPHPAGAQRLARTDDHAPRLRIEAHDIERMTGGDAEPPTLADREVDDARMASEPAAFEVDDVARLGGARLEPLDHLGVAPGRHKADVLAVVLVGDREAELPRQRARLALRLVAERKPQDVELIARGGEQEIALVPLGLARAIERACAVRERTRGHVVAGRQHLGAELARGRKQVAKLDRAVALDTRHRGLARDIARREAVDHHLLEAILIVEHVVGNADPLGHEPSVVNILPGAAGALAVGRGAMIVELQRHSHDVVALGLEQCRRDRRIDAARHGHHHAGVLRSAFDLEAVEHAGHLSTTIVSLGPAC